MLVNGNEKYDVHANNGKKIILKNKFLTYLKDF